MPSDMSRFLRGIVLTEQTGVPQAGLTVLVLMGAGRNRRIVGRGVTAPSGRFEVRLDKERVPTIAGQVSVELQLNGVPVEVAPGSQTRFDLRRMPKEAAICVIAPHVCAPPNDVPLKYGQPQGPCVYGVVRHLDGTRLSGVVVKAFTLLLSGETEVQTSDTTDAQGVFQIVDASLGPGKDILVRVTTSGGNPELIGTSAALFQATSPARLDVIVKDEGWRGKSEFEKVEGAVTAVRQADASAPEIEDFTPTQVLYIASKHQLKSEQVALYVVAWRIAVAMDATDYHEQVYGLLRVGWPRTVSEFLSQGRGRVQAALARAFEKHVISRDAAMDHEAFLAAWVEALVTMALSPTVEGSFGVLLSIAGLVEVEREAVVQAWVERTGSVADFWDTLREDQNLEPKVDDVQRVLQLALLCANHTPMVGRVFDTLDASNDPLSKIAEWEYADWEAHTEAVWGTFDPVGYPDGYTQATYIALLLENAEAAFPTKRTTVQLYNDVAVPQAVKTYIDNNQNFDLATSVLTGTDEAEVTLRKYQRLYRVAPSKGRYAGMSALATDFDSARGIDRMGRKRFLSEYTSALGDEDTAIEVYNKARALSSLAAVAWGILHPNLYGPVTNAMAARDEAETTGVPNYENLFGNADWCGCDPCLSIHSPAAYMVDLLDWVDDRGGWSDDPATDVNALNARRPDLGLIELSCENTYRVLPYVDLVNEVLENAVDFLANSVTPTNSYQTTLETSELLVTPEHVKAAAYDELAEATHSHQLPYHLWNAQSRVFLGQLGLERSRLLRVFQHANSSTATPITDTHRAAEELGLCATDVSLITTTLSGELRWGGTGTDLDDVAKVKNFLLRANMSYGELLEVLHCTSANTSGLVVYEGDSCDLDTFYLSLSSASYSAPSDTDFARLSRFIRLWRALGGTPIQAERVLQAFDVTDANSDAQVTTALLVKLGDLRRIERRGGVDRPLLCTLWHDIDVFADREAAEHPQYSLYERLFLDPRTFPEAATEGEDWVFRAALSTNTGLAEYTPQIAAALQVDVAAIDEAIAWAGASLETGLVGAETVTLLNLANLSALCRRVVLARVARVAVWQAEALAAVSTNDPFESPTACFSFLEELGRLNGAGLSVDDALYLANHQSEAAERVGATDSALQNILGQLRDHVWASITDYDDSKETYTVVEPANEESELETELTSRLEEVFGTGTTWVATFVELVLDDWLVSPSPDLATEQTSRWTALRGYANPTGGDPRLADYFDLRDLRARIVGTGGDSPPLTSNADRFAYVFRCLAWGVHRLAVRDTLREAVEEKLSALLGCRRTFVEYLRERTLTALAEDWIGSDPDTADAFLTREFLAFDASESDDPYGDLVRSAGALPTAIDDAFSGLEVLVKGARLFSALGIDEEEEAWWFGDGTTLSASDLGLLAVEEILLEEHATNGPLRYQALIDTVTLFAQRGRVPGTEPTFAALLDLLTSNADFQASLVERTGWSADDVSAVSTAFGYAGATPGLDDPYELERLLDALEIGRRTGAGATIVLGWTTHAVTGDAYDASDTDAAQILAAARSRYPDLDRWSAVARPLRDALREQQRRGLVAWLLDRVGSAFEDTNDLYAHYLIDVEMGPSMLTSRIKQACCSIQLFIQRNLLGFDAAALSLTDDDREEWEWMKNYRVWEAARKVFLYPENWIEPELRDDKTPFFKSLESELSQGELTEERVEEVVLSYLDRMREVHNLHVVGYVSQYEVVDGETIDYLHVIARTRTTPAVYYYRRWEDKCTWTAWEKLECGIEGDYVLPVIYDRRLMVFWATLEEDSDSSEENGDQWYTVRLNWTEYWNNRWSGRRVSANTLSLEGTSSPHLNGVHSYSLYAEVGDTLTIAVLNRFQGELLGFFTFDTCTLELSPEDDSGDSFTESTPGGLYPSYQGYAPWYSIAPDSTMSYELHMLASSISHEGMGGVGSTSYHLLTGSDRAARVSVTRQYQNFTCQTPFFFGDENRVFFVRRKSGTGTSLKGAMTTDTLGFSDLDSFYIYGTEGSVGSGGPGDDVELNLIDELQDDSALKVSNALASVETYKANPLSTGGEGLFVFEPFHHPYVCTFIKEIRRKGIFGLLRPDESGSTAELARQQIADTYFNATYSPTSYVATPYPEDEVDFSWEGAYSQYNWELFFHLPFYVANRLSDDQRFQEAMDWYHTVFDPRSQNTDYALPYRYWMIKPFQDEVAPSVADWEDFTGADGDSEQAESFENQVAEWREDPFNPHLIARLRPGTYQKAIFMHYLDNLIAWGDNLFQQDTIESINEATQLYVLAAELLGDRPVEVSPQEKPEALTWEDIRGETDAFGNVLVEVENTLFTVSGSWFGRGAGAATPSVGRTAYFCVPPNEKLLGYWDTVADRLFKIRNGMNIEGVRRTLALFEPPIDPALLVAARAAGLDIRSVLASLSESLPNHRFRELYARAQAFAGTVRSLANVLQGALEKRDAEELARLRSTHELTLLDLVKEVKKRQVDEAESALEALKRGRKLAQTRYSYYDKLIGKGLIGWEIAQQDLALAALALTAAPAVLFGLRTVLSLIPEVTIGIAAGAETGGQHGSDATEGGAQAMNSLISSLNAGSSLAGLKASFKRREQEWTQQRNLAKKELEQVDEQILGARIRLDIVKRELTNHERQREQSAEVDEWMRRKFTNQELYNWMISQVSGLYFRAYELAVDMAFQAQQAFRHELGLPSASYIQYGYWDSLRKGLLAGERLGHDLERMESAYLAEDVREYEITRHVSLDQLDPVALVRLREEGECWFDVPEALFDLDCPGHYFRRIQSVSLSLACVHGPMANVNVELTLSNSWIRREAETGSDGLVEESVTGGTTAIVTSTAQDDAGLFQLDLRDPRYLPFERRGAVSRWHLRLCNQRFPAFDWSTITDAVLHLRYTALDGGETFRGDVLDDLDTALNAVSGGYTGAASSPLTSSLVRGFSAKRDFPDAWYVFQQSEDETGTQSLALEIAEGHFPTSVRTGGSTLSITGALVFLVGVSEADWADGDTLRLKAQLGTATAVNLDLSRASTAAFGLPYGSASVSGSLNTVTLSLDTSNYDPEADGLDIPAILEGTGTSVRLQASRIDDIVVVLLYDVTNTES